MEKRFKQEDVLQGGETFIEHSKGGVPTTFTITLKKPFERYEFDMKNRYMEGHWVGTFAEEGGGTRIEFTEKLRLKNPVLNLFAGAYLKRQQATYVADLRKALGE